jgi:ABC-2 type transport system ATP-binding protein
MENHHEWIIQTNQLSRNFGKISAVNQINLEVPAGSVYGFLGPNGAGKTTTIRLLLGLIQPTFGSIKMFGHDLDSQNWQYLKKIGTMVESPSLYPNLTGRENLEVTRRLIGLPKNNIDMALDSVNMLQAGNRLVKEYSMGMRQRLGLALALINQPTLLILDEPTNGLDPAGIQEMRDMIRELPIKNGVTVFLSSHLLSEVEQTASHIGIIHEGHMLFQGSLESLRNERNPILHLGSDNPEQAAELLKQSGWKVRQNGKPGLLVEVNGNSDVAFINRKLNQANINVFQLSVQQPSLEDTFLQLTTTK